MNTLFGTNKAQEQTAQSAAAATAAQASLGNAAKKDGDKAKKGVAGFDQLNLLQENLAANAAGAAMFWMVAQIALCRSPPSKTQVVRGLFQQGFLEAAAKTKVALESLKQTAGEVAQFIANAFGPPLMQVFNGMIPVTEAWKNSLGETFQRLGTLGAPFQAWLTNDLVPLMQKVISTVGDIAGGMAGSLLLVFNSLREAVFPILEWFVTDLYVSGGYSGTYSTNIYRLDLTDKSAGWLAWKSLSTGVQRHSMEYANGTLFIIVGRDATTYRNIITSIDTTTKEVNALVEKIKPSGKRIILV